MTTKPGQKPDFLTLMAVTSHLMTCYATRPCPILARKAADHLQILLETHEEELGPWWGSMEKLYHQWMRLAAVSGQVVRRASYLDATRH